jgi:hypothetical protein
MLSRRTLLVAGRALQLPGVAFKAVLTRIGD